MKRRVPTFTTDKGTWLHRRDPRAKWIALVLLISLIYVAPTWQWMAALTALGLGMAVVARVPAKGMALVLAIQIPHVVTYLAFPAVARLLAGEPPLAGSFAFPLKVIFSWQAALFLGASIFTTMTLTELTDGLRGLAVPEIVVFTFEYVFLLFFLTLSDFYRTVDAMKTKGVNVDTRNPVKLARNFPRLGIPLVIGLLRRSNTMMAILKMRGYRFDERPARRTDLALGSADVALVAYALAVVVLTTAVRFDILATPPLLR